MKYQLLASGLALVPGILLGLLVVSLWRPGIEENALRSRTAFVESLTTAVDPDRVADLVDGRTVLKAEVRPAKAGETGFARWEETLTIARRRPDGDLLVVEFGLDGVYACIRRAYLLIFSLVAMFAVLGYLTVGWLVRTFIRPIEELRAKMNEVQSGDLSVELEVDRADEIGDLGRHFNAMVKAIRGAREQTMDTAQQQANIEKFAALGRLSAGVAHEINNPVGGILAALDVIREMEPGSKRYRDYLELMKTGLERIGDIVSQLLRFARQPKGERTLLDLNVMLRDVSHLARLQYRSSRMHIVTRFGEIPPIRGQADLLNQLFLNLAMNAYQAMVDGGILTISTSRVEEEVLVRLEDTGPGIPSENLDQLFEPFFTTKEVGEGTGLGLSVALGIVEAHGGTIDASNRPEGGASFTVRLPVAEEIE
jgi:signal transduction histidine kinase